MINNFDYISVTDDDIKYAEKILFGKVNIFDEERIAIIENFRESFDVNACPGSGKTTVLLAKLIILSRKMPLKNGQGICVLTHTNVAIDEIKNRLGEKSDILFKYPNYFGTIQSFINKYLAIPYFKKITGENIKNIDNDAYYSNLRRVAKNYYPRIQNAIDFCIEKQVGNYRDGEKIENFVKFISSKPIKIVNNKIVICNWSGASLEDRDYYEELYSIVSDGVLKYDHTYLFAKAYIEEYPNLTNCFSKRFQYVFIDEMQDTDIVQANILEKIFNIVESSIVQRFGDINQRIGLSAEDNGWRLLDNVKYINSSKRYGAEIVRFLQPLRILKEGDMKGNNSIYTIEPHIIIFNDNSIRKVINKFIDIINKYNLDTSKGKIKVIGKIGIPVESPNLSIKSYTDSYIKHNNKGSNNKKYDKLILSKNLKEFYDNIISIIVLSLDYNNKKITSSEFIRYIQLENNEEFLVFKSYIKKWFCNISINSEECLKDIIEVTSNLLSQLKKFNFKRDVLEEILVANTSKEIAKLEEVAVTELDNKNVVIDDINTVFGVKGETHLATLYLESKLIDRDGKNRRSDMIKILDYMLGKNSVVAPEDEEAIIAAYVAMSRAQRLTCIAISYETIQGRIKEFKEYGYEIMPCDDEIEELIKKEI